MAGIDRRLRTDTAPLDELVDMVRTGTIRIPTFQRGLRWTKRDVIRLFDSIVLGYPIGNLLLWRRHADQVPNLRIGALVIEADETENALFVVDGQQRLTSLANSLSEQGQSDPRFAISYDVQKKEFIPSGRASAYQIPLPVVFDLSRLLEWYRTNPELSEDPTLLSRANDVAKRIREYRVALYTVDNSDPEVLRDIFDRMNNYGKQLSRAEIFSALNESSTGERTDNDAPTALGGIASEVHAATGFGLIDQDTILLAMLARRGPDVSRDIRREFHADDAIRTAEFPGETSETAHFELVQSMVLAIRFLQVDAACPHFSFLPYRYLLVVLTRFFAHHSTPSPAIRRNLRRWFWRAASLGPELTRGSITQATRALSARIRIDDADASVAGLLEMIGDRPPVIPPVTDFRTNWATSRLQLASMWHTSPRRIDGDSFGSPYTLDEIISALGESSTANGQVAAIYPGKTLEPKARALPANRILLAEPPVEMPEYALDPIWVAALRASDNDAVAMAVLGSHEVDSGAAEALLAGDSAEFVRLRQDSLYQTLRDFLSIQAEWEFEDTPALSSFDLDDDDPGRDDVLDS